MKISGALGLVGLLLGASACELLCDEHESAQCFVLPDADIEEFRVTLGTGNDGSDADIYFCIEVASQSAPRCDELESFDDDFMEGAVQDYEIELAVDRGDFISFWVENRGGAFFGNDDWEPDSIVVTVVTSDSEELLYEEPEICSDELDAGEDWHPRDCEY